MTPESQRIAIAGACGWVMKPIGYMMKDGACALPFTKTGHFCIPDYLTDLNAMNEAEKVLNWDQTWRYCDEIRKALGVYGGKTTGSVEEYEWHASAAQRAEAFLRTIGKWDDSQ